MGTASVEYGTAGHRDRSIAYSESEANNSSLGSLSCLPPELVIEILIWVTVTSGDCRNNHRAPSRLMEVCRRFQQMISTTSRCWTTLVVGDPIIGTDHLPRYIERSGTQPLFVWLFVYPFRWDGSAFRPYHSVVRAQQRWKAVYICSSPVGGYPDDLLPPSLPLLEEIHVEDQGGGMAALNVRLNYPRLRVLRAGRVNLALNDTITTRTLEELEFNLRPIDTVQEISSLLRMNHKLRRLQVETSRQPRVGVALWIGVAEVVLPALESATFVCQSVEPVRGLINVMYAEKLSSIDLAHYALDSGVDDYNTLLGFCIRRFPKLASITFKGLVPPEWIYSFIDELSSRMPKGCLVRLTAENLGEFIIQRDGSE